MLPELGWILDIFPLKKLLIELDDATAEELERVAPARSRKRSEFVRSAIRRALWELEEKATAEAYRSQPDAASDAYVDAQVWESRPEYEDDDTDGAAE